MAIKEQSQRQLRVGQEIKRIIASEIYLGNVRNLLEIDSLVTIMEVQVSPDLKYAVVYFVTSNQETNDAVFEALSLASNHFRKTVAGKTNLRYVPKIVFKLDNTLAEVDKIERLLRNPKVAQDLED